MLTLVDLFTELIELFYPAIRAMINDDTEMCAFEVLHKDERLDIGSTVHVCYTK